jgi:hypothetical protein
MGEIRAGRLRARVTVTLEGPFRASPADVVVTALSRGIRSDDAVDEVRLLKIEDVEVLNGGEEVTAGEAAGSSFFDSASLDALAARQGVRPAADFEALLGDFWPEDESADEFIAAVRECSSSPS